MNSHRSEPAKDTGEIPVSLNMLAMIYSFTIRYLRIKGLFYVLIGLTWIFFRSPSRLAGISWLSFLTEIHVGLFWIVGGIVPFVASYFKHERARKLGFFLLVFVSAVMGAYFAVSWMAFYIPFISTEGYSRAGITTVSYWAYSISAYLMAHIYALTSGASQFTEPGGRL